MVEDLRKQVEFLISAYEKEKLRADDLASKLSLSLSEAASAKQQIAELTDKLKKLEIASAIAGGNNPAQAKLNIDKMVRQINDCIKLLEN